MTARKPLIGVVADLNRKPRHPVHSVGDKYIDAVTAGSGGLALLLPALIDKPGAAFSDASDNRTGARYGGRPVPHRGHLQREPGRIRRGTG